MTTVTTRDRRRRAYPIVGAVLLVTATLSPLAAPAAVAASRPPVAAKAQTRLASATVALPHGVAVTKETTLAQFERARAMAQARKKRAIASGVRAASTSAYPDPPGQAPPGCSTVSTPPVSANASSFTWPVVTGYDSGVGPNTTQCYLDATGYSLDPTGTPFIYTSTGADQTLYPGQTVTVGAVCATSYDRVCGLDLNDTYLAAGQPAPVSWSLRWNNLFDPEALIRSVDGEVGNAITGYDTAYEIQPQLGNCYNPALGYTLGRQVDSCTLGMATGPYYGTPPGESLPWSVLAGAAGSGNFDYPEVFNCGGTCAPSWDGVNIEDPVFLQPSPYAGFGYQMTNASTVSLTDETLSDLPISSWSWNFGDGTTGSGPDPTHTYTQGGTYNITLRVVTNDGQTSTATAQNIDVAGALTVSAASVPPIGVGQTVTVPVTVTNNNFTNDPITGISMGSVGTPADGSVTLASGPTPSGPFDLAPGASTTVDYTFTGVAGTTVGDAITFSAAGTDPNNLTVTGMTSDPIRVREAVTVTSVTPAKGQVDGGTVLDVTGTGFTTSGASPVDLVTEVDFDPQNGGTPLVVTTPSVTSDTTLTVTAPSAMAVMAQNATMATDIRVVTAVETSPVSAGDVYTYGCDDVADQTDGDWQFGGCFNQPDPNDFTGGGTETLDGLSLTLASGTTTDFADGGTGGNAVTSKGSVSVSANPKKGGSAALFTGALNLALGGAPQTLTAAAGAQIGGLPIKGTVTLTPSAGGVVTGVVSTTLPAILGGKAAVLTFVSSESAGVTSVTVAAPEGGSLGQLFGLTITSFSLNVTDGKWSVAGTALTSSGASTKFTGTLTYSGTTLTGGGLTVDAISLAGILDLNTLTLTYAKSAWSGSATIVQQTHTATIKFGFLSSGALSSGSISTGAITLFNAIPLKTFDMTYTSGAWSLAATAATTGGGTLGASLAVNANGAVTGASLKLSGGNVSLFGKLTLTSLLLDYSTPGNVPTYKGAIGVQLPPPATVVSGVSGSLTMANGKYVAASLEVTGNVPLADGLFLSQLGASVKAATPTTGTDVCGSVGITGGPTIGGNALIGVKGAIDYTYPLTTGSGFYRIAGELTVPDFVIDGGVLGNLYMTVNPGAGKASFLVALGPGSAAGHCPVQPGPSPSPGITLGKGIKITGTLSGDVSATNFIVTGAATFSYPALFTGTVSGNVAIDSTDITACAAKSGSTGSWGFTLLWDGEFTTWSGNCPLTP